MSAEKYSQAVQTGARLAAANEHDLVVQTICVSLSPLPSDAAMPWSIRKASRYFDKELRV